MSAIETPSAVSVMTLARTRVPHRKGGAHDPAGDEPPGSPQGQCALGVPQAEAPHPGDFAALAPISPGYLSQLVIGDRSPSPRTTRLLLDALDVEFGGLFYVEETDGNLGVLEAMGHPAGTVAVPLSGAMAP